MPEQQRFSKVIPWILFLVLLQFTNVFPRYVLSPLLLRVTADFGVTFDVASAVFLTASLGFTTGLLASGFVSSWLAHRWTMVSAIALCGCSVLLLSMAQTIGQFHLLIFVVGFSNGLYPGSSIASVQKIAAPVHRGKALGLHEAGPNLALIAAPLIAALLAPSIGWRGIMRGIGIVALGSIVLFVLFGRASQERGEPPHFENLRMLARKRSFWLLSAVLVIAGTGAIGVFAVLPTYLVVDHGLTEQLANSMVGVGRIGAFGTMVLAGTLADRFGFKPVAAVIVVITGVASAFLGLTSGGVLLLFVIIQPTVVGAFFPVCWVALSDAVSVRARNLSVSLAMALSNIVAGGVSPRVLAAIGARGHFRIGFVVLGCLVVAGSLLLLLLPRRRALVETA